MLLAATVLIELFAGGGVATAAANAKLEPNITDNVKDAIFFMSDSFLKGVNFLQMLTYFKI